MEWSFGALNWVAILVGVVVGQVVSTIWFVVLFGEPWARAYGAKSKKEHTEQVPGYTYGVGAACTFVLTVSIALLHAALSVTSVGAALSLGVLLSVGFCVATCLPGQAFLRRYDVAWIACGSQTAMILAISAVLVAVG